MKGIVFRTEIILLSAAAIFLFLLEGLSMSHETPEGVTVRTDRESAADQVVPVDGPELDINTAGVLELSELPGIGEALAGRIVAYREENGPFTAIEDIQNVRGIGEETYAAVAEEITVGTDEAAGTAVPAAEEVPEEPAIQPEGPAESGKLNINTAGPEELMALPGIGEILAGRIIAYREENGPFAATRDIQNVRGIGEGKFAAVAELITVGTDEETGSAVPAVEEAPEEPAIQPEEPAENGKLNINTAGPEELMALPGIGEVLAGRIIAYREENGPFTAIGDIQNVRGIGEGKFAAVADLITVGDASGG